jgi:tRNA-dihydrouridine synthase A
MNRALLNQSERGPSHRFCVAPMMEYTDRHCRYLFRLLSRRTLLYTEMVTATALARGGSSQRHLDFDQAEHPIALQLGGSNPRELAYAAQLANRWGYDEVNLNVGCPSNRVTSGSFGACLMAEPLLVADCIRAMRGASPIPVTVKTRIGIDDLDEDHHLDSFVDTLAAAGCNTFIIHARKAWLQGLSPKDNRKIPPLNYARVFRLKHDFPNLEIILNGGIQALETAQAVLARSGDSAIDGVMLGRSLYNSPYMLAEVDHLIFSEESQAGGRSNIVIKYLDYARTMIEQGARAHHIYKHMVGLYHGCAGARLWRQTIARLGQNHSDPTELIKLAQTLDTGLSIAA